jgi:ELWxxDGT repeat protein
VDGSLYFSADDGRHGRELWTSDGSEAGTVILDDLYPGAHGSRPRPTLELGGEVFFVAKTPATGRELWMLAG